MQVGAETRPRQGPGDAEARPSCVRVPAEGGETWRGEARRGEAGPMLGRGEAKARTRRGRGSAEAWLRLGEAMWVRGEAKARRFQDLAETTPMRDRGRAGQCVVEASRGVARRGGNEAIPRRGLGEAEANRSVAEARPR
jgi:hypothetical protein